VISEREIIRFYENIPALWWSQKRYFRINVIKNSYLRVKFVILSVGRQEAAEVLLREKELKPGVFA
jgi:hypothetical protein